MTKKFGFLVFSLLWISAACSSKSTEMDDPIIEPQARSERPAVVQQPTVPDTGGELMTLDAAFFELDRSTLKAEGKKAMKKNAEWLKKNPKAKIQIEGHCDERGSDEYNLKLGQRRADATKAYLISQGVAASRITTVSYGRVPGSDYDRNRRAAFIIIQP